MPVAFNAGMTKSIGRLQVMAAMHIGAAVIRVLWLLFEIFNACVGQFDNAAEMHSLSSDMVHQIVALNFDLW